MRKLPEKTEKGNSIKRKQKGQAGPVSRGDPVVRNAKPMNSLNRLLAGSTKHQDRGEVPKGEGKI